LNQNELYKAWVESIGTDKQKVAEEALVASLRVYAAKICWKLLRDSNPDVVNTACYQAIKFSHQFKGDAKFTTWFHKVVENLCTSHIRKKKRKAEVSFDDLTNKQVQQLPTREHTEVGVILGDIVSKLTKEEQEFLRMKQDGHSDEEIGEVFNISPVGVRVRWMRLRKKLKEQLS
jgi:RNA polymerase sigma-70 factor, ECF subfamily